MKWLHKSKTLECCASLMCTIFPCTYLNVHKRALSCIPVCGFFTLPIPSIYTHANLIHCVSIQFKCYLVYLTCCFLHLWLYCVIDLDQCWEYLTVLLQRMNHSDVIQYHMIALRIMDWWKKCWHSSRSDHSPACSLL